MKNAKSNIIVKSVLLVVVIAVGVISLYYAVVNRKVNEADGGGYPTTTYDILVSRDFEVSYPATPYEVLKTYNKYLKYIYNTETSHDETEALVDCIRSMWSKEWLELNEHDSHVRNMESEAAQFREDGKVLSNYTVNDSATVKKFTTPDNVEGCALMSSYLFTLKKSTSKVYMMFYFLKEEGKWKILYYDIVDEAGNKIEDEDEAGKDTIVSGNKADDKT